jgi:hypothetical protein
MHRSAQGDKRTTRKIVWTGNRPPMKHGDFRIGREFLSGAGRWRCTDVGTRIITAIRLNMDHDPTLYNGPPYIIAEQVFDEYDMEGCEAAPKRKNFDDGGRGEMKIVKRSPRRKVA